MRMNERNMYLIRNVLSTGQKVVLHKNNQGLSIIKVIILIKILFASGVFFSRLKILLYH